MRNNFFTNFLAAILVVGTATTTSAVGIPPAFHETKAEHDARMQWFRDAKFGMFIHWGLYSQLAGEWQGKKTNRAAKWIQEQLAISSSQYSDLVIRVNLVS